MMSFCNFNDGKYHISLSSHHYRRLYTVQNLNNILTWSENEDIAKAKTIKVGIHALLSGRNYKV